ncbi:ionotropic receptor 75a-like, partial [Chrysoperla carnea]|uniref:ionotropic receptor 75a-like n=1 Tax=Chrysoperla carnea TaxID=189513 RepID=UPI001D0987DB
FEQNTRFLLHVCFPIDFTTKKQLGLRSQYNIVKNSAHYINDKLYHQLIRVLDMDCPSAIEILLEANSTLHFILPNRWVLLFGKNTSDLSESLLLDVDSNVLTARIFNNELIHLKQPYKYNRYETYFVYETFGFWAKDTGVFDQRTQKVITHRRRNLNGYEMKQSYFFFSKDTPKHLEDFVDAHIDSNGKHSFNMNKLLCFYVNATQKYRLTNSWGRLLPNGSWTGVVKKVQTGEDDVTGSAIAILGTRLHILRYISRTSKCRAGFIFRMPALSKVSNILRLSFQTKLWGGLGLLLVLVIVIMKYLFTSEVKRNRTKNKTYNIESLSLQKGWASIFVFIVGSLCQQGVEKEPEGVSGRVGTFFVYLSMLFIYTSYSANIVALLQASASIENVDEFMQSPLTAGLLDFEFSKLMFENSTNPIRKQIYDDKVNKGSKGYYSYAKGVENIRKGGFAFYAEPGIVFHYISKTFEENEKCDLQEIGTPGEFLALFHATPHNSPYVELFRNGLLRLDETGLQQRWYLRIYKSKPKCGASVANFVPVGIIESYWAFVIWAYGVGFRSVVEFE